MTKQTIIEWAAHWVPDEPPGQRKRFADALSSELDKWTEPVSTEVPNTSIGCFDPASSLDVFR
jgi:hypothetical protein